MESLNNAVAANLKRLRAERQLSLDGLSELTCVSKSMLGQIERGETSPTITTIWKIANGLKVSFSSFLAGPEPASQLLDEADVPPLLENKGNYKVVPFFGVDGRRNFEIFSFSIKPGGTLDAEPHFAGTQEFILVYSGELTVRVDNAETKVGAGQAFRFGADAPHGYRNDSDEEMKGCMVLYYPG